VKQFRSAFLWSNYRSAKPEYLPWPLAEEKNKQNLQPEMRFLWWPRGLEPPQPSRVREFQAVGTGIIWSGKRARLGCGIDCDSSRLACRVVDKLISIAMDRVYFESALPKSYRRHDSCQLTNLDERQLVLYGAMYSKQDFYIGLDALN